MRSPFDLGGEPQADRLSRPKSPPRSEILRAVPRPLHTPHAPSTCARHFDSGRRLASTRSLTFKP